MKDRITRYKRLMEEIIKSGVKTKVLMLSATPVNNRMNDIKNQIAFITEGKNNAFAAVGLPIWKPRSSRPRPSSTNGRRCLIKTAPLTVL